MPTYTIWTIGCQMNKAESLQIADHLEKSGYTFTPTFQNADVIILNTCVVRQSAEDKIMGMLSYLKGTKRSNPELSILVTGCFVNSRLEELEARFPHVDLFFGPGSLNEVVQWIGKQQLVLPRGERVSSETGTKFINPTAFVPIIQGCNNFCSYCIVPYRRGRERSRPQNEIVNEITELVQNGIREVTLLGQNVNSYGQDLESKPRLSSLLQILNDIDGLDRIRFLTNHPRNMGHDLLESMARLDKVCEHITLPLQSGDDSVLKAMKRGYDIKYYSELINTIRECIPKIALSTDIIVGFPGETDEQFNRTVRMIEEIKFDNVHIASYSARPETLAFRELKDDVPAETKKQRFNKIEALQTKIAEEINQHYHGQQVEVLVEGKKKGKWYGRSRSDKLVFFEGQNNYLGQLVDVKIIKTSPWALQGEVKNE